MIINIGFNKQVFKEDILFILNRETVEMEIENKKFVEKYKVYRDLKGKEVQSYIVAMENNKIVCYPSYIKSKNLIKS